MSMATQTRFSRYKRRRLLTDLFHAVVLVILIVFILLPIYWMVTTSLKTTADTFAIPPKLVFQPTLAHYQVLIEEGVVLKSLVNSLIVATTTTLLAVLLGTPAAYVFARFEFRGKSDLWFWVISNRFITPIVMALPFFLIARDLKLLDTRLSLILIYLTFNLPLVIWLSIDQFRVIPREIDEAALVDGASLWQAFYKISLPLALPSVTVAAILSFIFSWNEFLYAFVLTRSEARTAPVEAANFMTAVGTRWGPMMATGTLIVLPVVIFAAIVSRNLVRGLTLGAVK